MKFPLLLLALLLGPVCQAQPAPQRIHFKLKNTLGHRGYRVEGPGIAYGFTMNRGETTEKNWPVGAKLFFSTDGETPNGLILTVERSMAGQVVPIRAVPPQRGVPPAARAARPEAVPSAGIIFRNNSFRFRSVALISYAPGQRGNGTEVVWVVPYGVLRRRYPLGTRVYVANEAQVRTVMSGQSLNGPPRLTVTEDNAGRIVALFP